VEVADITEDDFTQLSNFEVNGREVQELFFCFPLCLFPTFHWSSTAHDELTRHWWQIKNAVRTAQSIALNEEKMLSMAHLLRVLFVGNVFAKDLKGPGYEEALKLYTWLGERFYGLTTMRVDRLCGYF